MKLRKAIKKSWRWRVMSRLQRIEICIVGRIVYTGNVFRAIFERGFRYHLWQWIGKRFYLIDADSSAEPYPPTSVFDIYSHVIPSLPPSDQSDWDRAVPGVGCSHLYKLRPATTVDSLKADWY